MRVPLSRWHPGQVRRPAPNTLQCSSHDRPEALIHVDLSHVAISDFHRIEEIVAAGYISIRCAA